MDEISEEKIFFPELQLSFAETRVLGCLMEKEVLTPAYYPMTLNSLVAACNQSSSRHPVTSLDTPTVEEAIRTLRNKRLVVKVSVAGSRVPKYKHWLEKIIDLEPDQKAILTVLLLRGIQTAGEIKQRTERMHSFESVPDVEESLQWFMEYPHGSLVKNFPVGSGRRVATYAHLLGGQAGLEDGSSGVPTPELLVLKDEESWRQGIEERLSKIEERLNRIEGEGD